MPFIAVVPERGSNSTEQVRAEEQHAKDHNLVYTGDTSIPANALVRGDKVQVRDAQGRPDVATVKGSTDDGRIILQDGVRMTFGENDMVPIQGLSLNEHAGRQQQGWGFKTKAEREQLRMQRAQRRAVDAIFREEARRRRQEETTQARQDEPTPADQGAALRRQWDDLTRRAATPDFVNANVGRGGALQQGRPMGAARPNTATNAADVDEALNLFMLAARTDEQRAQMATAREMLTRRPESPEEAAWQESMREQVVAAAQQARQRMQERGARRLPAPPQGQAATNTPTPARTQTRGQAQTQAQAQTPRQIEYSPQAPAYPGDAGVQRGQGFGFRPKAERQAQAQALIPYMPQETTPTENATAPAYPGRPEAPALPRRTENQATETRRAPEYPGTPQAPALPQRGRTQETAQARQVPAYPGMPQAPALPQRTEGATAEAQQADPLVQRFVNALIGRQQGQQIGGFKKAAERHLEL